MFLTDVGERAGQYKKSSPTKLKEGFFRNTLHLIVSAAHQPLLLREILARCTKKSKNRNMALQHTPPAVTTLKSER
jgi:hypothetical protein